MDRVIRTENGYLDLISPVSNEISPYDATYPVELLSNGLKLKLAEAENVVLNVFKEVSKASPMVAQIREPKFS